MAYNAFNAMSILSPTPGDRQNAGILIIVSGRKLTAFTLLDLRFSDRKQEDGRQDY